MITVDEYKETIKKLRKNHFPSPFDIAYDAFVELGFNKMGEAYFKEHASDFVEQMRERCWKDFQACEKEFTVESLSSLIDQTSFNGMGAIDAIKEFVSSYSQHIYELTLSNTQSRRSRAGKEFEAIIEMMLIGANIPTDSQGNVGKQFFAQHNLGKLVDFVTPGAIQYSIDKQRTVLISAKTTLRERWQEVPEEVNRTGASHMYLATLDDGITEETLDVLYESNITIVTTKENQKNYKNPRVVTFEEMIAEASSIIGKWEGYAYTSEQRSVVEKFLSKQIKKHGNHPIIRDYYKVRLSECL